MDRPSVRVCFTPDLLKYFKPSGNNNLVVVDILRATTSMCVALANGALAIVPVTGGRDAIELAIVNCRLSIGNFLIAGEKDGVKHTFADLGNSPLEFRSEIVEGKTIVFSTTNGTRAICESEAYGDVIIASFVNYSAILKFLIADMKDVIIVCAGWKGQFSMEDTLFAGKLAKALITDGGYIAGDDAAKSSLQLWTLAADRLLEFATMSSHYQRLNGIESEEGLRYCFEPAERKVLPKLVDGRLIDCGTL